jgi:hypothetical protein
MARYSDVKLDTYLHFRSVVYPTGELQPAAKAPTQRNRQCATFSLRGKSDWANSNQQRRHPRSVIDSVHRRQRCISVRRQKLSASPFSFIVKCKKKSDGHENSRDTETTPKLYRACTQSTRECWSRAKQPKQPKDRRPPALTVHVGKQSKTGNVIESESYAELTSRFVHSLSICGTCSRVHRHCTLLALL